MKMRVLYGKRQLAEKMKKSGGGASPIPFESPTVPQLAIVLNNHWFIVKHFNNVILLIYHLFRTDVLLFHVKIMKN